VEGEDVFQILSGVPDTGESGLFYLEWRARMYSRYSPVFQTPGSQGYSTWSGGRGCIPDTPRCSRHRGARVILPGVEGEDIFRILPGVGDAGVPVVEGEADHQVAAGLKHGVAAHKPTHLHVR
jgi:hypothetical protein